MEIEKMHFDGQIWRPPYEAIISVSLRILL